MADGRFDWAEARKGLIPSVPPLLRKARSANQHGRPASQPPTSSGSPVADLQAADLIEAAASDCDGRGGAEDRRAAAPIVDSIELTGSEVGGRGH